VELVGGEVEAAAAGLVGRRLDRVRYYTLPYGMTESPSWDHRDAHATDYGLDLITDQGIVGITWIQYGNFGYGLRILAEPLVSVLHRAEFTSVDHELPWSAIAGSPVTSAVVHRIEWTMGAETYRGPMALTLGFADALAIVLACGSWRGTEESVFPTGDDIVVVWKPETAAVLLPYFDQDALGLS
jgi:hypothetical protein